jgi:tRNA pseudouridine32 synthase/23S rRNA pseudouridine746 synthase
VTVVEPLGAGLFRLTPSTGRTHQLRVHMNSIGLPIDGDPLYPTVLDVPAGDFSTPLQLLAHRLAFTDPVTGTEREFVSARTLET